MAFAATALAAEPRAFSVGPWKIQLLTYSAASGDTSGTITADRLTTLVMVVVPGVVHTAQPTYSGNVATLAFADPAATIHGQVIAIGR